MDRRIFSGLHCGRENGALGSLATRRVAEAIGRAFGKPSFDLLPVARTGAFVLHRGSLGLALSGGARGNLQSYCRGSIDTINRQGARPLALDGEQGDLPEWRL